MSSEETGAEELLRRARARGLTIATAESCTGGLLGAAITAIPGASDVYLGGFITYSNAMKRAALGVPAAALEAFGAVSEEVAEEMARGARAATGADLAVSITGIAGPGGSEHKPEGRVCFALAHAAGIRAQTVGFRPLGRESVRMAACDHALKLLVLALG